MAKVDKDFILPVVHTDKQNINDIRITLLPDGQKVALHFSHPVYLFRLSLDDAKKLREGIGKLIELIEAGGGRIVSLEGTYGQGQ